MEQRSPDETLPHLVDEILLIQPSSTKAEDAYAWLPTNPSGDYSSKSGYLALHLTESMPSRNANIPDEFNGTNQSGAL